MSENYAMDVADLSYSWYLRASKRSRRAYPQSELALVALSASIPLAAATAPQDRVVTALLGYCLVILAGVRAISHWQENYLRFSRAREAVEAERRLYRLGVMPYDDPFTRDDELVKAVARIGNDQLGPFYQAKRRSEPNSYQANGGLVSVVRCGRRRSGARAR